MENYQDLLEIAKAESGLANYGDEAFIEGLEILVDSLNTEASLNSTGEHALRGIVLRYLRQRLEVEEWYRLHPETGQLDVCDPLFGVSLPRTGSTALSYLLSCDPGVRYLRTWESAQPFPPPSTVEGPDPRRGKETSPVPAGERGRSHTPTGIDGPYECLDLNALDFKSHIFLALAKIPKYADWLLKADLASTYEYERRALKMLRWGEPDKPWRLKSPSHLIYIDYLDEAFPDAKFVMTHRDPTDVILSVATLYADLQRSFTDEPDLHYIGELNIENWATGMERLCAFRNKPGNDARFYDIHFRAMQVDPVGEVRGLYNWLGEEVTPGFEEAMKSFWEENEARDRFEKPDPAHFGINYADVRERFSEYLRRMEHWAPYPKPSSN